MLAVAASSLPSYSQDAPHSSSDLRASVDRLLDAPQFENATWGVKVVNLLSGEVLYERNARKSFVPASNMKLYTSAAALNQLGPGFTYETRLYAFGSVVDSVLHGHLVVRGSGDPTIGGRYNDGDLTATFRDWADSLRDHGIARINGGIVGDDDVFDDVGLGVGWNWDDETYWYSAEVGGLVFNDNCVDVTITGTSPGRAGEVTWAPGMTDYVDVVNATLTIHPDSSIEEGYERERASNRIRLYSGVPAGRDDRESITVANPTRYFVHVLRSTLVSKGVPVSGNVVDVDDAPLRPDYSSSGAMIVARYVSPPLSEIAAVINKPSHNLWAEQLLKTLGLSGPPDTLNGVPLPVVGTAERGVEFAMSTFAAAGVDTSRFRMADGSGLSRMNLITPEMNTNLLRFMWTHPDTSVSGAFLRSLPVGGVDGTIDDLVEEGPAVGNLRAKTGSLTAVRNLSGYIRSGAGTPLAFALLCNNFTVKTKEVSQVQRAFVDLLARYRE